MTNFTSALNGIVILTAVYSLISVGLVLIFRATRVLNFAGGALGLVGAYIVYALIGPLGGFYPALLGGLVLALLVGAGIYRLVLAPISGARGNIGASTDLGVVLGTIILATLLDAIVPYLAGGRAQQLGIPIPDWSWSFQAFRITFYQVACVVVSITVIGALALALPRLRIGMAMRATADNPRLAGLNGISSRTVAMISWALAAFVSTLGVVMYTGSTALSPESALALGAAIFPALLLGGLDSIIGAVVGSVVLATIQSATAVYVGGNWVDVTPYIFLLVVLIFRPHGFFGHGEFSRL